MEKSLRIIDFLLPVIIIAINMYIHIYVYLNGGQTTENLIRFGASTSLQHIVKTGEWYRLFTSTFLHINFMHLLFNMQALLSFGAKVQKSFGIFLFIIIYILTGLASSGLSLFFRNPQVISLGASGSVFGIMGALLVILYFERKKTLAGSNWNSILFLIFINLAWGFSQFSGNIDNAGHIGGLVAGIILAFVLSPFIKK
ncbi:MAG: rhomboid family intramembrane serine protease [Defluviitaleaceae bacterium]|nr:rhomboid family intramembrane serine protease [Defluviitaleaceae bacterium]